MTKNSDVYRVKIDPAFTSHTTSYGFEVTTAPKQHQEKPVADKLVETRTVEVCDSIVNKIIDEHISRAKMGEKKYGHTLDRTDLSLIDYLQHTKEELMDAALYIEKTIQMLKGK